MDVTKDQEALLAELKSLRQALGQEAGAGCRSGLVLLRMCSGLGLKDWTKLSASPEFREWLALPLDENPLPCLERIQETIRELSYLTEHDHLTKLSNRGAFDRALKSELDRAHRAGASLSLAMLDLDDFKRINDTFGHPCGDEVLKALSKALLEAKRTYDFAARLGGEEFALLLPGVGMSQASIMLERLLASVRSMEIICPESAAPIRVTISAGLACTKGKLPISPDKLVSLADKALYEAKRSGKDKVVRAPIIDLTRPPEKTLVRSDEKNFLFTGSTKG